MRDAQLLVHAGAPSTRQGDEQHTAQARAYLELLPISIPRITSLTSSKNAAVAASPAQCATSQPPRHSSRASPGDAHLEEFIDDTQLAHTVLQSQLFASSVRVVRTRSPVAVAVGPVIARGASPCESQRPCVIGESQSATLLRRTVSEPISQSSYLVSPAVARSVKRARRDYSDGQGVCSEIELNGSPRVPSTWAHPTQYHPPPVTWPVINQNSADGTISSDETTSELPNTYSLSTGTFDSLENRQRIASPRRTTVSPALQNPSVRSHESQQKQAEHVEVVHGTDSHHEPEPRLKITENEQREQNMEIDELLVQNLSREIRAPAPEVSTRPFTTHVTKMLRHIAENAVNDAAYSPVLESRPLKIHERGYWLLDCSSWRAERQVEIWRHLETFVGNGNAGWGIWCTRGSEEEYCDDKQGRAVPVIQESNAQPANGEPTLGPIKLWCWGEVVKHTYLMLHVISIGRVRKLGMKWIDSDNNVVVQMRGRE